MKDFDSMDIVLATALFVGAWKDIWWPFWLFAFIMAGPVLFNFPREKE